MQRRIRVAVAALLLLSATAAWAAMDEGTNSLQANLRQQLEQQTTIAAPIKAMVISVLLPMSTNPVWVQAVEAQNAKNVPLQEIKDIDTSWNSTEDELPTQRALLTSACAKEAMALSSTLPAVRHVIVTDNQGASVCVSKLSRDYWLGDKESWKASYAGGNGGIAVDPIAHDTASSTVLQQVSLPIIAKGGQVIGAVTFGIAVTQ